MYRIPNRIFVGGIPQTASQDELKEDFSHFGQVKDARIITDPRGNSRGYANIFFSKIIRVLNLILIGLLLIYFSNKAMDLSHMKMRTTLQKS